MKLIKYLEFIKEALNENYLPTYEDCVEMCSQEEPVFYESKTIIDNYPISTFNYRLAQHKDFIQPIPTKPNIKAHEMRGITFVFNKDGSLYKRYLLLEKFFNLNQVSDTMYSVVKNYKIKFINNKEDGSIASFIRLPNGKVIGKSKMGFDNDQANGINRIYKTNGDISSFVDWCLDNEIMPIFEYVAPQNRIVLRYPNEELILLRMRDNKTGKHINIKDYYDKLGTIKIAPFEDDIKDLDSLIELTAKLVDKEGFVVQAEDENGKDFFFKLKTPWYTALHGLLTDDIYREHIIIGHILDDKIDDVLGQIPEDDRQTHERINKIISIVRKSIDDKITEIEKLYEIFKSMDFDRKLFASKFIKDPNFPVAMNLRKGEELKKLSQEDIIRIYGNYDKYEKVLNNCNIYNLAKEWLREKCKRLQLAREFLKKKDSSLFFQDIDEYKIDDN